MTAPAPITETLASALILFTPWKKDRILVDPFCGSGTFPIEALPKVFQWIYPFLPFQFGMKAFKECIAGMYGVDYWINVGKMVLFLIIALLLGLALEPPFRKLNRRIEKSKEKTGLMI